jgi:hypothetical protein
MQNQVLRLGLPRFQNRNQGGSGTRSQVCLKKISSNGKKKVSPTPSVFFPQPFTYMASFLRGFRPVVPGLGGDDAVDGGVRAQTRRIHSLHP